jgi:hypothetical protein
MKEWNQHVLLALSLLVLTPSQVVLAQSSDIDPRATELLERATTFLANQPQLGVDTHGTIEVVLESGQKIQFDHATTLLMQRPDKLRAERSSSLADRAMYYDGQALTVLDPRSGNYASVEVSGTLEEGLDYARETLDIVAPAGDLLYTNAFEILMEDVTSGFVVGRSLVEGTRCDHLAFRNAEVGVDWQLWIREGDQPLPCRLVITTLDVDGAPQFTVVMNNWNLAPTIAEGAFDFTPPEDAEQVGFEDLGYAAPQAQ